MSYFRYDKTFNPAFEATEWDLSEFNSLYSYGSVEDLEVLEHILSRTSKVMSNYRSVLFLFQQDHLRGLLNLPITAMFHSWWAFL